MEKLEQRPRRAQPKRTQSLRHEGTAERFRYFLETCELSREAFVAAIDGAVSEKTLYALLDGTRKPGRALCVLIERTWGFRAEFLLEGKGAMWSQAQAGPSASAEVVLSPAEARVIAFMRRSVENAREQEEQLARAELWEALFAHTLTMLRDLQACAQSDDPAVRARYPAFVRLAYDECIFAAQAFARYVGLHHQKRVHQLTDRFLTRFVLELGTRPLSPARKEQLLSLVEPARKQRAEVYDALQSSTAALELSLRRLLELGSAVPLFDEEEQAQRAYDELGTELLVFAHDRALSVAQRRRLKQLSDELREALPRETFARRMQRMTAGLLSELDHRVLREPTLSVVELEERRRAALERLRGL